ncbi:MAG: hypothetical protein IKG97_07625 [Lachnospiraceae bacterium]|nr:hypothetical protein [Lachnospiraceae bacterium]
MSVAKVNVKQETFWWTGILIPLALGALFYMLLNSEQFLTRLVFGLYGPEKATLFGREIISESLFVTLARYTCDFLLAFSLVFSISYWMRDTLKTFGQGIVIALVFEFVMEVWRFATAAGGAFRIGHVVALVLGNALAAVFILIHEKRLY